MGKTNFDKRLNRYLRDAETQTIHIETRARWPRRWLFFGPRMMPVLIYIRGQARLHSSMQKRLNRAVGEKTHIQFLLDRRLQKDIKTQNYINAMKVRINQAAAEGLTVVEWLERDRKAARLSRQKP